MRSVRSGWWVSRLLAGAFLVLLGPPAAAAQVSDASPAPRSMARFGEVPDFRFVERSGEPLTRADLLGAPWIAVPFFVGCTGPCPSVTSDLRAELVGALDGSGVKIVSFSVDPEFDTPERLREYAAQYDIGADEPWLFVTGDAAEMERFLLEGLKTSFMRSDEAGLEYGQSITHTTRVPVVDPQGRIAGWYQVSRQALAGEPDGASFEEALGLLRDRALALAAPAGGSPLPRLNAILNGTAAALLLAGWFAIRRGRRGLHGALMRLAFLVSAAFLASYLYYHGVVQRVVGPVRFRGTGAARTGYYVLLASHVILAIVNLPMVLRTLWLAHREDWERHKRLARKTFPIWLYVSVTGVLVYLILYSWNPAPAAS